MSLNLTVHGNPSGHSGPAIYCQELTRALSEEGVNIALSANSPINHQHVPKDIIKLLDNPGKEKDPLLSLETPLLWWKYMAYRRPFIGSVVFEGDRIPYGWVLACTQQETDQIWCPSFHTASAVREGAIATRQQEIKNIKIIPHGYNPELFNKKGKKADIYNKEYFTFLYVGGWSKGFIDRKGLDIVYRAFKNEFKEYCEEKYPKIASVINNITSKPAGVAIGEYEICLAGSSHIKDKIGPYEFEISANSFFQTNTFGAKRLYETVKKFAELTGKETVIDLYSGTGTIPICISDSAKEIIGIEIIEGAVEDAENNCANNNISNCRFICGDIINRLKRITNQPDVMIIDPPRSGMHKDVVKQVINMAPDRIVYVSCNPATLARDIFIMKDIYRVIEVQPVDLFPHTYHIESVAKLKRR